MKRTKPNNYFVLFLLLISFFTFIVLVYELGVKTENENLETLAEEQSNQLLLMQENFIEQLVDQLSNNSAMSREQIITALARNSN